MVHGEGVDYKSRNNRFESGKRKKFWKPNFSGPNLRPGWFFDIYIQGSKKVQL